MSCCLHIALLTALCFTLLSFEPHSALFTCPLSLTMSVDASIVCGSECWLGVSLSVSLSVAVYACGVLQ